MVEKNYSEQVIMHFVMILLSAVSVLPLVLLAASSLTAEPALLQYGYSFFPREFSLNAYEYLLKSNKQILRGYGITIFVTATGSFAGVLMTMLFAYPLSRKELPWRKLFSFVVFFTMLFNGGLVPSYIMWTQTFHIKNTILALILPNFLMNAFYVILMRSFFTTNIPDSLIEAARIDGCGEYRILFSIIMPLSIPMVVTLLLMIGLGYWNDWTNSLYYITNERLFSIQAILNTIIANAQYLVSGQGRPVASGFDVSRLPTVGMRMAIAVIGILPVLLIYPFFQRYFIKGIVVGGVKG
jgi:putative aldouronate transport system permease protein